MLPKPFNLPALAEAFDEPFADSSSLPTYLVSQLAAQIPTTFAQSQGGPYYTVSVSGATLTLHRLDQPTAVAASLQVTRYGGAGVTPTRPVGASVALEGTPAAGEIWTLTLDGNTYATGPYSSGGPAAIAAQLAALIPTTPAAAHGGAYYTVSLPTGGTTLTIRRVDQAAPVTASVSVSNPATAKTVIVTPTKTTVEYSGIVTTLKGAITVAYTVSVTGTASDATLTIVANAEDTLDAFGSVVLDTQETQGTATATASGSTVTVTLPSASVVATWSRFVLTAVSIG